MFKLLPKKRSTRLVLFVWIGVFFAAASFAGYKYFLKPAYKDWREKRANEVAREQLKKGDLTAALAAARKAIQYNRSNVDAWRLAVEITEKQDSPQMFVFQQGLADAQPTLENKLKFIRIAIKYNAYPQAQEAINKMGPEAAQSVEFYELASKVALTMRNQTKAKYYLMSLVKLKPDDNRARLDLAQIRLVEGFEDNKPSIRAEIRGLANDPALRVRALTLLLTDATQNKNEADALEFATLLAATPEVPFGTQLTIAEAYRQAAPARFTPYLDTLKVSIAEKPDAVPLLAAYLSTHDLSKDARTWIESLPVKTRETEGVQIAYSAILLALQDFSAAETFLRSVKWTENEYARQALLAFTARKRGDERMFNEAWRLAVIEVGNNPRRLQSLLSRVSTWGWPDQRLELLWKRFTIDPSDKTTRSQIFNAERARQNTAAINRLFGRINENDPSDRQAKNNYAYTSLLLGTSLDRAHTAARENYDAEPQNPFFVSTYALSLYRQNKPQDALRVIEGLDFSALASPERSIIQGLLLVANGRTEEGLEQTAHINTNILLPEERRLLQEATTIAAKAQQTQASAARIASLSTSDLPGNRKTLLNVLPTAYRTPSVQLELADSLYASDDYRGLESSLRGEDWGSQEFIRLSLIAYAQKNLGKDTEFRGTWRALITASSNRSEQLIALEEICERWNWTAERLEILNRIIQRDPSNDAALAELAEHYRQNRLTSELARIYGIRVEADNPSADDKSYFAYYSLLTNTNLTKAHILARQAYESAPEVAFHAKTYALSLLKQNRPTDASRAIEKLVALGETGPAQLNLLRAAITVEQGQLVEARNYLNGFDSSSALPEEAALADALAKTIAAKNT